MKKSYVFFYTDKVGSREAVKKLLDSIPEISHWRFDMPNSFYLVSEESAEVLATKILQSTNNSGRFLITEYSENSQGWLTKQSWYLLNNKDYAPKK
ncbi:MAG: hypothetical protein IH914_04040 [candidate division Zixibacteria bacterium]|nr:hypothetical protein [candidate division Zixibacteria bacterium]